MRQIKFFNEGYYHLYNRGVEKRDVFLDQADFHRFMNGLGELNFTEKKMPFVAFICYCLMPNHFHLVVRQVETGGITKLMHKVLTGYTMYFNKRYERSGVLFQGTFKAKYVENNQYLLHLSRYVHLNPLELYSDGEERPYDNLVNYRWSSLPYYLDPNKRPAVKLEKEVILEQFKNRDDFARDTANYTSCNLSVLEDLRIEA